MATGVKPREDDIQLTRSDLECIQEAMKNKKFRELLSEYCEEVRDPANQAIYQKEMTQLEKERGFDVKFINPKAGYVIKTSVAGDQKAFINICSNENVCKPSYKLHEKDGRKGMNWQIPYSIIPPREDYDKNRKRCVIYDVVFHPDTLRMAEVNQQFRELVNKTAIDGLQETYKIYFDKNNFRFPKSSYKGMTTNAVIRKEDPNYVPKTEQDATMSPEMLEKLYPQSTYSTSKQESYFNSSTESKKDSQTGYKSNKPSENTEFIYSSDQGYTIPKYVIKQQKNVDFQEFTNNRDSKQFTAIPSHIVVDINLPLLSSTKDCVLDIVENTLKLLSEKPAKYKLNITLPYRVNDECGHAKFDKAGRLLTVTLPVIRKNYTNDVVSALKVDSGVESEENSGSLSDEDQSKDNLVEVLNCKPEETNADVCKDQEIKNENEEFLQKCIGYLLPTYTYHILDDTLAFTFHVKNAEPDSVKLKQESNTILIKFTSVGSGFVPVHYAGKIIFDDAINLRSVTGEAWDNNVILQLEIIGNMPQKCMVGLHEDSMKCEIFEITKLSKCPNDKNKEVKVEETAAPVVEVTNLGTETNIVVSSNQNDSDDEDYEPQDYSHKNIVWTESEDFTSKAKSILRKPRSFSESSYCDVASSADYISSDCIPEESSLKKTVRFNHIIAKKVYRYNSSIEGQKRKNQRKKSKKRNLERQKSESEAEEENINNNQTNKPRTKSVSKQRRDSGLADTSDADTDGKNTPNSSGCNLSLNQQSKSKSKQSEDMDSMLNLDTSERSKLDQDSDCQTETKSTYNTIKHNTKLYDHEKLNKGKYLEVSFKNDLIFDLDM